MRLKEPESQNEKNLAGLQQGAAQPGNYLADGREYLKNWQVLFMENVAGGLHYRPRVQVNSVSSLGGLCKPGEPPVSYFSLCLLTKKYPLPGLLQGRQAGEEAKC